MTYTVQLDFFIEEDAIKTNKEVEHLVKEIFDYCNCIASNVRLIDVGD
jgi:hypothetical protein